MSEICTLSDEDREVRRKELRDGLVPLARAKQELPDGIALLFDASAEIRSELDAFVAFETRCCPVLEFSVREVSGGLRLEITGMDPGGSLFSGLEIADISAEKESEQREASG